MPPINPPDINDNRLLYGTILKITNSDIINPSTPRIIENVPIGKSRIVEIFASSPPK